jgi:hypothetical protein
MSPLRTTEALAWAEVTIPKTIVQKPGDVPNQAVHSLGEDGISRDLALDPFTAWASHHAEGVVQQFSGFHGFQVSPQLRIGRPLRGAERLLSADAI